MKQAHTNRFQDFFEENVYVFLKRHLYNYQLRRRAVGKHVESTGSGSLLEIGSGISPVLAAGESVVYSDISLTAMQILQRTSGHGLYVVADSMNLPFKNESFSQTISSEVLEHLADDRGALRELARVMKGGGKLTMTFPHRKFYFANDDRFVGHFRRYELDEMRQLLKEAGMEPLLTEKVMGPLEKLTMSAIIFCLSLSRGLRRNRGRHGRCRHPVQYLAPLFKWINYIYMWLAWLDVRIMPRCLSTVLLLTAVKKQNQ